MQSDVLNTIQAWVLTVLLYPGLLFGTALVLTGEWAHVLLRPLLTPRMYRPHLATARRYQFFQPLYNFLKLAGRQAPRPISPSLPSAGALEGRASSLLSLGSALAPMLALALMPFPGSPITRQTGPAGDVLLVLALLSAQPLLRAAVRLMRGGTGAFTGAQELGRYIAGLLPTLVAVAALLEVWSGGSLLLAALSPAPETAAQSLVRLLSGAALLVSLPWWVSSREYEGEDAAGYAGRLMQGAALAAFWALVALPAPGERPWALAVSMVGALFAYLAMRFITERVAVGARRKEAANLLWATALPAAAVALAAALWAGA